MSIFVKRMDQYQTISSLLIYLCVIFLSNFIIKIYKNVYIKLANFANLLNSMLGYGTTLDILRRRDFIRDLRKLKVI